MGHIVEFASGLRSDDPEVEWWCTQTLVAIAERAVAFARLVDRLPAEQRNDYWVALNEALTSLPQAWSIPVGVGMLPKIVDSIPEHLKEGFESKVYYAGRPLGQATSGVAAKVSLM